MPRHVPLPGGCQCEFIGLTDGAVEDILEAGGIPLVSLRKSLSGAREFKVAKYEPGTYYTALCHVWSDGLGDEKGNRIASCQFDALKSPLSDLSAFDSSTLDHDDNQAAEAWKIPIWFDTFCVPQTPIYRKLALRKMSQSYELASIVLVLDQELQRWLYKDAEDAEALLRIQSLRLDETGLDLV